MVKINSSSAAYSATSTSEQTSADIFHSLLDRRYVMGNANVLDKVPNTDGLMTMVGPKLISIGRFDIQLKTLKKRDVGSPKFQCEIALLAYAKEEMLPVILVVVDQQNKKAYWRHLDKSLIDDAAERIKGKSISIPLLTEQCLDGQNQEYIAKWTEIVEAVKSKVLSYDLVDTQRQSLLKQMGTLNSRIIPAISLNAIEIHEIHLFLDRLNNLLDNEFKIVKNILYAGYWKIGIAIVDYTSKSATYFLIPQRLSDNSPLIKEVKDKGQAFSRDDIFMEDGALILAWNGNINPLKEDASNQALTFVCKEVFKVVSKIDFAIPYKYAAFEYLSAFVEKFQYFLGVSSTSEPIQLSRLKSLLFAILPLAISTAVTFSEGATEYEYGIDGYEGTKGKVFDKRIELAEELINDGFIPPINITLRSSKFDFKLIRYYIELLEEFKTIEISNPYARLRNDISTGPLVWNSWNMPNVIANLRNIFTHFALSYKMLVEENFTYLTKELDIFYGCDLIIYVFRLSEHGPRLEYFKCSAEIPVEKQIRFFDEQELNCPTAISEVYRTKEWKCTVDGVNYQIHQMGGQRLFFLTDSCPMASLLKETLNAKLDGYFKSRGLNRTPYNQRLY